MTGVQTCALPICLFSACLLALVYFTVRFRDTQGWGAVAGALFALNPNVLYLQSIPMTESLFSACLLALLYFTVRFRDTQGWGAVAGAGVAACAATLTRYEGWFLLPFAAVYFALAARRKRIGVVLLFSLLAALGPLFWLFHNWWLTMDPLAF